MVVIRFECPPTLLFKDALPSSNILIIAFSWTIIALWLLLFDRSPMRLVLILALLLFSCYYCCFFGCIWRRKKKRTITTQGRIATTIVILSLGAVSLATAKYVVSIVFVAVVVVVFKQYILRTMIERTNQLLIRLIIRVLI